MSITSLPGVVRVMDIPNALVYTINLDTKEQLVNPRLLTFLRNKPGARALANMISKITLSDVQVDSSGKLTANFNIYAQTSSPFGTLSTVLQIGAHAVAGTCPTLVEDTRNYSVRESTGPCVVYELGTHVNLVSLDTGSALTPQINRGLGMVLDFIFKFYSPITSAHATIYSH